MQVIVCPVNTYVKTYPKITYTVQHNLRIADNHLCAAGGHGIHVRNLGLLYSLRQLGRANINRAFLPGAKNSKSVRDFPFNSEKDREILQSAEVNQIFDNHDVILFTETVTNNSTDIYVEHFEYFVLNR